MLYFEEALRVLAANKVRSFLTVVGLIIGVGAVIAIQVLGNSTAGAIDVALGSLLDNSIIVFPDAQQRNVTRAAIKLSDLAVLKSIPGIISAQPIGGRSDLIRSHHHTARYVLSPDGAISFTTIPLLYGRRLDDDDIAEGTNVAVISNAAYMKLFPEGGDPTGESIYAGPSRYLVVGVLQAPKRGFLNASFGGDLRIPWTTFIHRYLRGSTLFAAGFIVDDPTNIPQIEVAIVKKLRELRGGANGLSYQTFDKSKFSAGIGSIFKVLTVIVGLIGAVSLLVAGIGIMNIMLVSVAERTREIGVRKAIGARRGQILIQFFIEALLLCGIGSGIGLGIGLGLGTLVNNIFIAQLTGTIVALPWFTALVTAAGFAAVVTLAFGTYPAFRAAQLDPIEALRYE